MMTSTNTNDRPTVLILGANGRLGHAAMQAFADAGWNVLAQVRRPLAQPVPARVQQLTVPLADTAALVAQAAGARVVLHALNPPYTRWAQELLPMARQGIDVASRLGALFMLPGNVYNFGQGMPALLKEDTPQQPTTRKGRLRCELEAEMRARAATGLRSVVLRAGDFFGAGTGTWLDIAIAKRLRKGKLVYPAAMDVPHAWAYLPDLARAFVALAAHEPAQGFETFHFAGHTLTGAQLLDGLERAALSMGLVGARGLKRSAMPWLPMRLIGPFVPIVREVLEMAYLWHVPHALDGSRLHAMLGGPAPATPLDDALRASLVAMFGPPGRGAMAGSAASGTSHRISD
jgi:nucleoside-diphosphate-sugar epimerase